LIGTRLGHYLVLERLGGGAMGEVYVAEDGTLNRKVALKLSRLEVSDSADRQARFQREARATAALNHPNIVHIYSAEQRDGVSFITMELVQGRSLRELLRARAPLAVPRTLSFAAQLAEGLACAHAAGILHRDLKPGNVMITDEDRVKILDFGLAKFFGAAPVSDPEAMTMSDPSSAGLTLGTAGYMSPEQALGKTLDPRTDLFALGAVLYEMATGKAPFEGDTLPAIFDQLLNRRPLPAGSLNPDLPAWLSDLIEKLLEKDPERRYRSAQEVLQALGGEGPASVTRVATQPPAAGRTASIVVLPFVDMSPQKDQEYFCHGVTEEIINSLAGVPGLRVISRTSAFAVQQQHVEVTEIGRRLNVATALEGGVRRAGERVRVTARLIDTGDGRQLWSKRFDREVSDVFAIQDDIAATIVDELRRGVSGPVLRRSTVDTEAHDAYLRGMYARNTWTDQGMWRAIADFRAAIEREPRFAPAYAALAEAYVWLYSGVGLLPAREAAPHARWAVDRALELDPALGDAHKADALLAMNHDWNRQGARDGLARAIELGPGSADARLWNAWRLVLLEREHDQAIAELEEAERLNPLDPQLKTQIGYVHHFRHDSDRAIEQFERVAALQPSFAFAHYALGDAWTGRGEYARAIAQYEKAIELGGRSANHIAALGHACGLAGDRDRALGLLDELAGRATASSVAPMWFALLHLGLGEIDQVFQWLDRACDERDGSLILITAAIEFDPVRVDPRFTALLQRMGLSHLASRVRGRG
jgi:serine/threonine protein kinase/tetratricopeptide (TPR) repeat protein